MHQVCGNIKQSQEEILSCFDSYTSIIDTHISEFAAMEQKHDNRVAALQSTTMTFNSSLNEWKPQVDDSIHSVKLELSKLNTYFNRDAKESSTSKVGVLTIESTQERSMPGSAADGPRGHRVDNYHRDCGYWGGGGSIPISMTRSRVRYLMLHSPPQILKGNCSSLLFMILHVHHPIQLVDHAC
jgi:hypothetical protein